MTESSGEPRVYYEMESITYLNSDELPDGLFTVPSPLDQTRLPSPRLKQRTASSLIPITQVSDLPLYPAALPEGYWIDSLISLDYLLGGAEAGLPVPVFQLDVYGPGFDELISIIQMRSQDSGFGIEDVMLWKPGCVVFERGGWIVAIFGELSDEQCALLVGWIAEDPEAVEDLLRQTSARDLILTEAEYYNP
ncbi:hypothetical protein IIA79_07715 [bacterium]|nr:hypothetical protein [bacterium]